VTDPIDDRRSDEDRDVSDVGLPHGGDAPQPDGPGAGDGAPDAAAEEAALDAAFPPER
jgi:hypothetical protein